ncbi:stage II sporulation protein M [Streptomyces sp. FIT100]|uniref:stage II sporulation protein M n=1 Tax=Streptomyces sp. FIT100 TaxID=2837956 RepID=UPI0021C7760F|nr:stage II sporulation protein M [Streptomyces sp. FIT100]UUN27775.1 stage II sporulation protein M [Streptomyces sp. FIT100]
MLAIAFSVSLAALCTGIVLGCTSMDPAGGDGAWADPGGRPADVSFADSFGPIVLRNTGAAMLLFSGALTAGFSTVVALGLMAVYIGATFGAAARTAGFQEALGSIVLYAPLEFLGLLLAATAGMLPVVSGVANALHSSAEDDRSPLRAYAESLALSLKTLGVAVAVILVAALVESVVIAAR